MSSDADRLAAIRERLAAATPDETWAKDDASLHYVLYDAAQESKGKYTAAVWYDDGDCCAVVHDNLGTGCDSHAYAKLFANAPADLAFLVTELEAARAELAACRQRCKGHVERIAQQSELLTRRACKPLPRPDAPGFWWGWGLKPEIYGRCWLLVRAFRPLWADTTRQDLHWCYLDSSGDHLVVTGTLWVKCEPPATPPEGRPDGQAS